MVAQVRAGGAPGLVGEGHKRIGVPRLLDEALARVFYRGCAGLFVMSRVDGVRALETSRVDGIRALETSRVDAVGALSDSFEEWRAASTAKLHAIDAAR